MTNVSSSIIVVENGDVDFFESKQIAERCLEPVDVINNEYIVYDSDGYVCDVSLQKRTKSSFFGKVMVDEVTISINREKENHRPDKLREEILFFLKNTGRYKKEYNLMTISQLIEKSIQKFGYSI